ncbi:MAG: DEAD/DEAH box helicase [Propionibacteriaceae bacterium]|jgi:ATP-dependent RNA helicase HelY|nr:DEAD/DEAH box helicase [Propionibacteriaceae bacterium]
MSQSQVFQDRYGFPLDDYQLEACAALADGSGVLVAAPTGAGKTVVGEFAVWLALEQGGKCFYTTPIKALSNQKHHDLAAQYGAERVGLLTGDQSINSEAAVVVMTTEVLRNMIYAQSATLNGLSHVVMDEVHYLSDPFRGPVWEEVILGLDPEVRLVGLSATVSNVEEFGDWLDQVRGPVATIVSERRPVPLHQHVFAGRRLWDLYDGVAPTALDDPTERRVKVNPELLRLAKGESAQVRDDARRPRGRSGRGRRQISYGSGAFGGAHSARWSAGSKLAPRRFEVVNELERQDLLPAIYFIFSRQGCDQAVRRLVADGVRLTDSDQAARLTALAERAVASLTSDDLEALGYERWLEAFQRGLAAHHAGLLPAFKQVVEEAFTAGLVQVVCATETLALGVNMPARTVVLDKLVKYNGQSHADITAGEYTQLTGRAGRRGIDRQGHAVVTWQTGLDPRALAGLAARRTYPLRSAFNPTANMVVNLIASLGQDRTRDLLERSFAQFQADRGQTPGRSRALVRRFDQVCGVLETLGYLTRSDQGLAVTERGRLLARLYGEQDLVVAEAVLDGLWAGLTGPQLAAVLSCLVYEARAHDRRPPGRMPDRASQRALERLQGLWRSVGSLERSHRLDPRRRLDPGFAQAAYDWAAGASLGEVIDLTGLPAGDFVRWVRQIIDLADQMADASGQLLAGETGSAGQSTVAGLARICRDLVGRLRRGVVDLGD